MANSRPNDPLTEWKSFIERTGPHRCRIRFDVVPDVLAWLMLHWHRYTTMIPEMPTNPSDGAASYVLGVKAAITPKVETIQELVSFLTDSFKEREWIDSCMYAGLLIRASDDDGKPLHKIGRALLSEESPSNGTGQS